MTKKKKKKRTIGAMVNSRLSWAINPVTQVRQGKKKKKDRRKIKERLKGGDYDV